jgi:hypothetical protein
MPSIDAEQGPPFEPALENSRRLRMVRTIWGISQVNQAESNLSFCPPDRVVPRIIPEFLAQK